jgi:hypothetical protein
MPGRVANPKGLNGTQKGLAALVRRSTKQGKDLVGFMVAVSRGDHVKLTVTTITGDVVEVERRPSVRDRIEAVIWLADRGWGKAKEVISLEGEVRVPVQIVLLRDGSDPLASPRVIEARRLPPASASVVSDPKAVVSRHQEAATAGLPEVGFTMDPP